MIKDKIVIPGLKAFTTGLFACLLAVVVSYYRGSPSWAFGGLVGAITAMLAWLVILGCDSIVTPIKNKGVGIVPLKQQTTKIQIVGDASSFQAGRWLDLPCSVQDLAQIAKRLQAGASFSHAGLAGRYRPISRSQYEALRDVMLQRGLLYWINPAAHSQGVELTRAGRAVIRHFSEGDSTVTFSPQLQRGDNTVTSHKFDAHANRRTRGNGREVIIEN